MNMPKFSLVLVTSNTTLVFFRDFMESMVAQVYDNWEMYILDDNMHQEIPRILGEFFPEDNRVHYRQLKNHKGQAYALNIGLHFISRNMQLQQEQSVMENPGYLVFANQHDRLCANTLFALAEHFMQHPESQLVYTDQDELHGLELVAPDYKPDFNKELLLRKNYIGSFVAISTSLMNQVGAFRERLEYAYLYDYLLRCMECNASIAHLPSILYHQRVMAPEDKKTQRRQEWTSYQEHMAAAQTYYIRNNLPPQIEPEQGHNFWRVRYPVKDHSPESYAKNKKNYMLLRDKDVRVYTRNAPEMMYGILQQPDVAVVGVRFLGNGLMLANCGYIYDKSGMIYPALYGRKIYQDTYQDRGQIPQDVSMVDFGFCMLNKRIYKKLSGFDTSLSGRELMLDYCLRAREAGYRIVVEPGIIARRKGGHPESSQESNENFVAKWQETLELGDPCYNPNLMMGLENYTYQNYGN